MNYLPPELIDSIIDHLDDHRTLAQCLIISRSWTKRCQLRLLNNVVLDLEHKCARTKIISLARCLDHDPFRSGLIRGIEIRRLQWGVSTQLGDAYATLLRILESTFNVQRIALRCSGWDIRAGELERTLLRLLGHASVEYIELDRFFIPNLPSLISLLSSPPNLTILRLKDIDCGQYQHYHGPLLPGVKRPKLETLEICAGSSGTSALEWLYHPQSPVNLAHLRHLQVSDRCKPIFSRRLLEVVAPSIEHLDLGALNWYAEEPVAKLTSMPFLRSLDLRRGTTLSWIQRLFSDLRHNHPLEVIRIRKSTSGLRADMKWLGCIDAYLTQPQLGSLRRVELWMARGNWEEEAELVSFMETFPILRERGLIFTTMI
ncbi:hypothetical protein C0991_010977 [Blastosporella zonata]|nr:hypothetical protein C0991_010977 [Blastosporella zonata]